MFHCSAVPCVTAVLKTGVFSTAVAADTKDWSLQCRARQVLVELERDMKEYWSVWATGACGAGV